MAAVFNRVRERKMAQWAIAYAAAAWIVLQVLGLAADSYEWPRTVMRIAIGVVLLGFVATLVLAWYHGERGQQRVNGTELLILALLFAVGGGLLWQFERGKQAQPVASPKSTATAKPAAHASPVVANAKSIAVLPFANLSSDKDNAYFADGIQDEILTRLAKIGDLKVISRTSTMRYASKPDNLQAIAAELGVANIVEGSVQKVGDSVRINVQLIRAADDTHLWAEIYDRKLVDVFGIQSEVAGAIAQALQATLTAAEKKQVASKPTSNAAAYDAYLKGLSLAGRANYSMDLHARARDFFAEATRLDPDFVEAWARLVEAQSFLYFNGVETTPSGLARMKAAAEAAVRIRPDSSDAWMALGFYRYRGLRDYPGAIEAFENAAKQLPNDANVLAALASVERRQGRLPTAMARLEQAMQLDPASATLPAIIGELLVAQRRFPEARAAFDRALALSPGDPSYSNYKAEAYIAEGDLDGAATWLASVPAAPAGSTPGDFARYEYYRIRRDHAALLALARGDLAALPPVSANARQRIARQLAIADALAALDDDAGAKSAYRDALAGFEAMVKAGDNVEIIRAQSARIHHGLGDTRTALAEVDRAIAEMQGDAKQTPPLLELKARLLADAGRKDEAIAILRELLVVPYGVTPAQLRIDPYWQSLHDDPRFRQHTK